MGMDAQVDKKHKYAVAVPAQGGIVVPIQSFETLEQLRDAYRTWQNYASYMRITKPVPIEFSDKEGKCRVLTDLLQAHE